MDIRIPGCSTRPHAIQATKRRFVRRATTTGIRVFTRSIRWSADRRRRRSVRKAGRARGCYDPALVASTVGVSRLDTGDRYVRGSRRLGMTFAAAQTAFGTRPGFSVGSTGADSKPLVLSTSPSGSRPLGPFESTSNGVSQRLRTMGATGLRIGRTIRIALEWRRPPTTNCGPRFRAS